MKLRNKLLTLSLVTFLVPWAGWKLVQELEAFLRAGQEEALLAAAQIVAQALPAPHRDILEARAEPLLHLRNLPVTPYIDGYADEWPGSDQGVRFESDDGELSLHVLAGQSAGRVYLHCHVRDSTQVRRSRPDDPESDADGLMLFLRSARGLVSFRVQAAAPGPISLNSQGEGGGQLNGFWLDRPNGYQVELVLPFLSNVTEISLGAIDVRESQTGSRALREAGTLKGQRPAQWLQLPSPDPAIEQWLARLTPAGVRAWLVDGEGWVLAETLARTNPDGRETTWIERVIYRGVAGGELEPATDRPERVTRFEDPLLAAALSEERASHWMQHPDSAAVFNAVAVPVLVNGQVRGAVVMEAVTDGLLLVTNRALGRVMLTTLLLTLGLAAALWLFASRLSHRVRRLSTAVSEAMNDGRRPGHLPLTGDRDELGELARNNSRLLRAVSEYTAYLQKLAGRLSHELKTPLAITRSSLDNLGSQALDEEARRYLERAREGLDRQAAIVRAMSEASRLEAAIKATEWVEVDLREVLQACVEGYRSLHAGRAIELTLPGEPCRQTCAPDLLAQALDKLVDNAISLTGVADIVRVSLECSDGAWSICVRNTGSRLPDVLPEQLFDSLVSLREKGGGRHLGLGLHIVRLVAEAHGGQASARNIEKGAGVMFCITLGAGSHPPGL
jgi:dedicated sortase system histidine kinase